MSDITIKDSTINPTDATNPSINNSYDNRHQRSEQELREHELKHVDLNDTFPAGIREAWDKFMASDNRRPMGKDSYEEVFTNPLIFPLQRRRELERMMHIARISRPTTVMEIGSDKGGGFYHWCKSLPTVQRAIACEIRGLPFKEAMETNMPYLKFHWMPTSSRDSQALEALTIWLEGFSIDCLFIDGEKAYFTADFNTYLPLLRPGSLVFMHDIVDEPMKSAFHGASIGRESTIIHDVTEAMEALQRYESRIPPTCPHEDWTRFWGLRSCGVGVIRV